MACRSPSWVQVSVLHDFLSTSRRGPKTEKQKTESGNTVQSWEEGQRSQLKTGRGSDLLPEGKFTPKPETLRRLISLSWKQSSRRLSGNKLSQNYLSEHIKESLFALGRGEAPYSAQRIIQVTRDRTRVGRMKASCIMAPAPRAVTFKHTLCLYFKFNFLGFLKFLFLYGIAVCPSKQGNMIWFYDLLF